MDTEPDICCQQSASCGQAVVSDEPDKPPGRRPLPAFPRSKIRNRAVAARKYKKHVIGPSPIDAATKSSECEAASTQTTRASATFSLAKVAILLLAQLPLKSAYPISHLLHNRAEPSETPKDPGSDLWVNIGLSALLVLLGGIFAGLTLGLMGQDEVYLQVIVQSGEPSERRNAAKVLSLLKRGKHWVLVTLLLGNVITNESLPIVLDRCLGGGWPAIVSSTCAIVVFGEIIPQSVSVRYGLAIGAVFTPFVLCLMYILYPVAYPIAMLLDKILGENHGTMYKRAGLKTLLTLHKTMGVERLNDDEVTIISAVLDLKDKPVGMVMTPIRDVFTMSSDRILDEKTIEEILHTGFNRIPIHAPNEPTNFIGMLLVRTLITYDPEDAFPISAFPLATLPETRPDTSCLNILNYFQEGKSHMIVVSDTPGAASGALGVLTLEDVIEELIGEEIIDESDVYVDVHRAIKRENPGPLKRVALQTNLTPRPSMGFESVYHALKNQISSDGLKPKLNPLNKASNPIATTNPKVTIKPAQVDLGSASASYSSTNLTELREIKVAPLERNILTPPDFLYSANQFARVASMDSLYLPDRKMVEAIEKADEIDLDDDLEMDDARGEAGFEDPGDLAYQPTSAASSQPRPEMQSYRTASGIIESVVTVQGVNKTIIEVDVDVGNTSSGGDSVSRQSPVFSPVRWGSQQISDEEINRPLLGHQDD